MTTHFPHADGETAPSYLASRSTNWPQIRSEYAQSVEDSMSRLDRRLEVLADREICDETLVIVTSDHGELLGEYSEIGHTTPLCPELVYVPCVFIHDSISAADFEVDPETEVIEHVDIIETVLKAIDANGSFETSGVDIRHHSRPREFGHATVSGRVSQLADRHWLSDRLQQTLPIYDADGIFWYDGGYSVHTNSRTGRLFWTLHRALNSAHRYNVRDDLTELLTTYLRSERAYGDPPIDSTEAQGLIESVISDINTRSANTIDLDAEAEKQLRDLGYVD